MNYELAKKLKDAGFPQTNSIYRFYVLKDGSVLDNHIHSMVLVNDILEQVIKPTLSELIEACDTAFEKLELKRNGWWAWSNNEDIFTQAETPEEAVARLWLELNKNANN